jgi:hypothetical protein
MIRGDLIAGVPDAALVFVRALPPKRGNDGRALLTIREIRVGRYRG